MGQQHVNTCPDGDSLTPGLAIGCSSPTALLNLSACCRNPPAGKDAGRLAAAWALYKAQEELVAVSAAASVVAHPHTQLAGSCKPYDVSSSNGTASAVGASWGNAPLLVLA